MESVDGKAREFLWRKQCEKQAHEAVEALIQSAISEDFFRNSLKRLSQQHYEDITIERSLSNLCGYCLCDKELPPVPQQTHKIVSNRVYDLTVRKRFCSNRCFTISCKISEQIPSTPLWLRVHENMTDVDITCGNEASRVGDEILIQPVMSKSEHISLDDNFETDCFKEDAECMSDASVLGKERLPCSTATKDLGDAKLNHNITDDHCRHGETLLVEAGNILKQWLTKSTADLLIGCAENTVPKIEVSLHKGGSDVTQPIPHTASNAKVISTNPVHERLLKHGLIDNINHYESRVSQFFGDMSLSPFDNGESTKHQEKTHISATHAHLSEARSVRENIVMKQILMLVDDLSPPLPNIVPELRAFVRSLNLTKLNVTARVELWPVLTISILFLLSRKNCALENILESEEFSKVLQKILNVCGTSMANVKQNVLEIPVLKNFQH